MKKKDLQQNNNTNNGISICDSIVMSVKKKRPNFRSAEAVLIAVIGYVSVIRSFLGMFGFTYDRKTVVYGGIVFSLIYILLSLTRKKAVWLVSLSVIAGAVFLHRGLDTITLGYKYVYNVIYHTSFHTDISYYKFLDTDLEKTAVTAFFLAVEWLLAVVIYFFTIHHPNPILPLLVTFPIIEVGLYNGIEIPVFWGVLTVAYWLALLAMSSIDMGEYTGGSGGFVRKDNLFFPKRQMRLKVTEKCGMMIVFIVATVGLAASGFLKATDYKRSDEINKKRIEIRDAVNSFSIENFADSVSNLTEAFGFTFKYQNHKLGNVDHLKYKNTVDLTVTMDHSYDGAVYMKEYTGSVYGNNSWEEDIDAGYDDPMFSDFEKYDIHPQDFPWICNSLYFSNSSIQSSYSSYFSTDSYDQSGFSSFTDQYTMGINSKLRPDRSFAPYCTENDGSLSYIYDRDVSSKSRSNTFFSYRFCPVTLDSIAHRSNFLMEFNDYVDIDSMDSSWQQKIRDYASANGNLDENGNVTLTFNYLPYGDKIYSDPVCIMTAMLENNYRNIVYNNYLQVPDTDEMKEVRTAFSDIIDFDRKPETPNEIINILTSIRDRMASMVSYSLNPGKTPQNRDFVNYFLLENHKGYCTHYATSGILLARMAGIPARYATGYVLVSDDFTSDSQNSDGSYTIELRDNRSHAWAEIYINGYGWLPFEFTAGYSEHSIDTTPAVTTTQPTSQDTFTTATQTTGTRTTNTRGTGTHTTHTKAAGSPASTTTSAAGVIPGNVNTPKKLPAGVVNTLCSILAAAVLVLAVVLRRRFLNWLRKKHMTDGSHTKRMAYIYGYTEKLLKEKRIKREDQSYADFAKDVEKQLSRRFFTEGEFETMTDTALRSAFSTSPPTDKELAQCKRTADTLAGKIYQNSGRLKRFYLRYIKALM